MKTPLNTLRIASRSSSSLDELASYVIGLEKSKDVDIRWGARRIPLSRGRHHGGYVCAYRGQPLLRVESVLERRVLEAMAAHQRCVALATQPLTFHWTWKGTRRRYTPDILIMSDVSPALSSHFPPERLTLIEVKPHGIVLDEELWAEKVRITRDALGMSLMRLPTVEVLP